jgi:surfeit locus 1 family protein
MRTIMQRYVFAVLLGVAGVAVLLSLGFWQLRRLDWKEAIIARADAMIAAAPVDLPKTTDPVADRYRAVHTEGRFTGQEAHVLTSIPEQGPGFLVIAAFETTEGRRILVDRGFVPETAKNDPRPPHDAKVEGNLNWPDDVNASTPPHDVKAAIWYGRDLAGISADLQTEPLLVVARSDTGDNIMAQPVTTAAFRNDHFEYAITWFLLAAVWLGMTAYLLWRIRQRTA